MNPTIKASDLDHTTPLFTPDEAWIDAFTAQCTDALRLKAKRYAKRRARGVGRAGGHVDDYYVRELVQDALTDTLLGVLAWNPNATPLENHVLDVIKSRTRHARKHAARYQRAGLDSSTPTVRREIETCLGADHRPDLDAALFAGEVLARLRKLAHADASVLRLLDAMEGGAQTKAEILELGNLSAKSYRNARDRLSRLVRSMDADDGTTPGIS